MGLESLRRLDVPLSVSREGGAYESVCTSIHWDWFHSWDRHLHQLLKMFVIANANHTASCLKLQNISSDPTVTPAARAECSAVTPPLHQVAASQQWATWLESEPGTAAVCVCVCVLFLG